MCSVVFPPWTPDTYPGDFTHLDYPDIWCFGKVLVCIQETSRIHLYITKLASYIAKGGVWITQQNVNGVKGVNETLTLKN